MTDSQPLTELQAAVADWAETYWGGEYWPPLANLARLTEEIGEVARAINQAYGPKLVKQDEAHASIGVELADAIFAILCLANSTGVDLQAAFERILRGYEQRESVPEG